MGAVCVVGAGLGSAIFCDIVRRLYFPSQDQLLGNNLLPVGLAAADPLPPDAPAIRAAVERRNEKGEPLYPRSIQRLGDTSLAEAVLRNGVTFNAESAVVLSAPATYLARTLDLFGVKDLYKARVKRLIVVDAGTPQRDVPALRKALADWPSPVVFCGREVGDALPFPASSTETDFVWASAHPVVDVYRGFRSMPYDAPAHDLAGAYYAVHPESDMFQLSSPGTLTVGDDGSVRFNAGGSGNVRSLSVDPAKKDQLLKTLVASASSRPPAPSQRGTRGAQ
jgi:hypothetical protein